MEIMATYMGGHKEGTAKLVKGNVYTLAIVATKQKKIFLREIILGRKLEYNDMENFLEHWDNVQVKKVTKINNGAYRISKYDKKISNTETI